ncbi:metal ABC transporter ATP-binding protein [Kitasatospora sp. DSM 101779]|uniref:metal ABC transporter ATP-binding protein n=1 Tax=Kitasatospora sp. DSM 101779 TaxID=2853165 RepID=UPI0021DA1EF6|nr:metal ABC transporter ATP-binding protein [Kitasatospora sp. DSM 101779]MCU7824894.1 metal ABC transporter ATP-binding protein [Kitasatospora sp. DSM 101779]
MSPVLPERTTAPDSSPAPEATTAPDSSPAPEATTAPEAATAPDATTTADAAADAAPGGQPPAVRLREAVASVGGRPVLRGVDLTVRPGEVVALLGANGSGKSTTVKAVIGGVPLDRGHLELFGTPYRSFRDWRRIGYVPQRTTAAGGVPATVREVVSTGRLPQHRLLPFRRRDRAAVDRALAAVGMLDRAEDGVAGLSGGQHQRVLIARALVGEPDLLIMDEPMAGVDVASQQVLADILGREAERGCAVLLVLHELGPLEPLIDRAVVLRDGCVAHDGPPPQGVGQHALPGHDHVHPHADDHTHTRGLLA